MHNEKLTISASTGRCGCGQSNITLNLPEPLEKYSPRACDCDFCIANNIPYLSHPNGELNIESIEKLEIQKQGSNQASFITCHSCKTVIAAALEYEGKLIGALNASLLSDFSLLQHPTTVSPKKLTALEKIDRWKAVWLNIHINGNSYL